MGQSFTATSIAAIVAVVVALAILIAYILIIAPKKGFGFQTSLYRMNKPVSNGVRARIMSMGTGKYLRYSSISPHLGIECGDINSSSFGNYIVTADGERHEAILWKLELCENCFPTFVYSDGGVVDDIFNPGNPWGEPLVLPVSGKWAIYDPISDVELRVLSFIENKAEVPLTPLRYDSARVIRVTSSDNPDGDDAVIANFTFNSLDATNWYSLVPIADLTSGFTGPNGCFFIQSLSGTEAFQDLSGFPPVLTQTGPFPFRQTYLTVSNTAQRTCYDLPALRTTNKPDPTLAGFFFEVI